MIKTYFNTIEDFIKIRDNCIFCNQKLDAILTTYSSIGPPSNHGAILANINSKLVDDKFNFRIKYTSISQNVDTKGWIDIKNNCHIDESSDEILSLFADMMPHIDLQCNKCKMNYYLSGASLRFDNPPLVNPFILFAEGFNIGNLIILNTWNTQTNIYNKNNLTLLTKSPGIQLPFIPFDSINKDVLINKVQTYATFF
jgi:hypothetical protein